MYQHGNRHLRYYKAETRRGSWNTAVQLINTKKGHTANTSKEAGLAMAISMFAGLLILVASTGLIGQHMSSRRVIASERYKQIAEMANNNGFSRTIALLNSESHQQDYSYLWELDKSQGEWNQSEALIRQQLIEPCTELLHRSNQQIGEQLTGSDLTQAQSLQQDGRKGSVQMSYKLSSQKLIKNEGKANEAQLIIEGFALQASNQLLSRSKTTRNLELREIVANDDDFAVMAGKHLQLGNSTIEGKGSILWLDNNDQSHSNRFQNSDACSPSALGSATASYQTSTRDRIWPIRSKAIPISLFSSNTISKDTQPGSNNQRVWEFYSDPNQSRCGSSACVALKTGSQQGAWRRADQFASIKYAGSTDENRLAKSITLHAENICTESPTSPCLLEVNTIQLDGGSKLILETQNGQGARPILLGIAEQALLDLKNGTLCQATYSPSNAGSRRCDPAAAAENLVILSSGASEATGRDESNRLLLKLGGNALPNAVIAMPGGTVQIANQHHCAD